MKFPAEIVNFTDLPETGKEVSLYPGELYVHTRGTEPRVWTLLGSCVSVALFNRKARIGAICHAQLAEESHRGAECDKECTGSCSRAKDGESRFRYLTCAFAHMVASLARKGVGAQDLSAYVLGGSEAVLIGSDFFKVGFSNIAMARKLLKTRGITVLQEETGGDRGRTLYYYPATGELFFRYHGEKNYYRLRG